MSHVFKGGTPYYWGARVLVAVSAIGYVYARQGKPAGAAFITNMDTPEHWYLVGFIVAAWCLTLGPLFGFVVDWSTKRLASTSNPIAGIAIFTMHVFGQFVSLLFTWSIIWVVTLTLALAGFL